MKIYINKTQENWVCDRFSHEFYRFNPQICTDDIDKADIIWVIAPWAFPHLDYLKNKKNIISIFHVVPDKFDVSRFEALNAVASGFHTICEKTKEFIKDFTSKPIYVEPFWVNQHIWKPLNKKNCRQELNLDQESFLLGSFQRDTEGNDLRSPKLEKGPDRFCDIAKKMYNEYKNIHVLLGGWRRQYVISRMNAEGIPYTYLELPSFEVLNKMYNSIDLYIVASRYEGGPQAIPECCATRTPIISTDVGCASIFLDKKNIFTYPDYTLSPPANDLKLVNYKNVLHKFIPHGFDKFISYFISC